MSPLKRHEKIMEALISGQEVTVVELSEMLQVTGKTVREDLDKLESMGLLTRVHGGAILAQNDQFGILTSKGVTEKHSQEKVQIAQHALQYIEQGDIIALDGGSTTLEIAKRLDNQPLTVITNDLFIINELTRKDQIMLVVPGGSRVRNVLVNEDAPRMISELNIHKAFISATAIHPEFGLSIYTGDLVPLKKAFIQTAQQVYGVVDHIKFGQFALRTFATCAEMDVIITDSGLPEQMAKRFSESGITLDYKSLEE
ncbi:DeoR/GlpR family DNA-binding transcription regulator [Paenibacillus crassostreae]|uniref:DeoR family transcriptional regulator n=1 Tax=Paenibacillus crassostreae TaxID=1763538 RepID=A0A167EU74_9BACL|nr:DeoR/GlpR family DNA-binding transcription regulator [Paenibacillus crassostreae]AOZ93463.1 DeoR family transcriptional regulator [Paenibacillus crassostreae]OAB75882.1 DeoR family transcriptional regulator [Paenibacillus crassostreae]